MTDNSSNHLIIRRDTHLFATRPGLMERLAKERELVSLTADQLLQPDSPHDDIVRLGKLRVSQFLADGREVSRAVLQAGAVLLTRANNDRQADPEADRYLVDDLVLMALGEVELWVLPAGALEQPE